MSAEQNLDGIFKGKSVPEYDTVNMAMDIPQEQAVQAIKLASSTGMSLADAAVNSDMQVTNNVAPADLNAIKETHPATASFLTNPIYLSSARNKDDLTSLTNMETSHKYWEALKNGVKGVGYAIAGTGQAIADVVKEGSQLPSSTLQDQFFTMANIKRAVSSFSNPIASKALGAASNDALTSQYLKAKEITSDSKLEQFALDVVQNTPQMAAQIALAYATGGTTSMAFMGTQIGGQQYADLKKEGVSTDRALTASVVDAAIQMPLERIGIGKILKVSKGGIAKKVASIAESALTEGMTEFLQQYPQDVTDLLAKNADKPLNERIELLKKDFGTMTSNAAYAGLIGAFMGGGSSAIHVALQKNVLSANQEQLDKSIKQTAQSPLLAKSPETLADFKNQLAGESQYTVDATALQTYAQEHPNEKLLEKLNINPEELKTAADTQQMVPVSTGDYEVLAAQSPAVHEALKNDVAFDEEGLSKNRADLLNSKEMMKQQEEIQAQAEELQTQKDNIYDNLRRIGLNDVESTSTLALLVSNAYRMSPDNPGLWLKEKAPTFIKEKTMPGLVTYGQETDVTKAPAFSKWFGDSKVIDGEGKPLVVYHTGTMGDAYDITKSRSYSGTPDYEIPGIYLTSNQEESLDYGTKEQVKKLYVSIQNPFKGNTNELHKQLGTWRKVMDSLIEQGYDGIIDDDGLGEIIAFNSNQIKSVDNAGTFDENNANIYYQSAFHGSPYNFDKFTLEHIGKGEGAQAHGHGLYVSLAKTTAEEYRNKLTEFREKIIIGKKEYHRSPQDRYSYLDNNDEPVSDYIQFALNELNETKNKDESIKILEEKIVEWRKAGDRSTAADFRKAIKWLENKDVQFSKEAGQVYEVDIPEDDVMLFEDKRFNEQSPKVQKSLKEVADFFSDWENGDMLAGSIADNEKGDSFYRALSRVVGGKENASKYLNELGVEGIRYNGNVDGECAVVFNDQAIKILNTYYQQNNGQKGAIGWDVDGRAIISLFEGADASTVIHETVGHYFVQNLMNEAVKPDAPAWMKKDMQTMLDYAGVDKPFNELTRNEKITAHEHWAEAAETYMMEGKAPTKELASIFKRFKKWLTAIYSVISRNDNSIPITDEVRGVFDRMLSAETDVQQAENLEGYLKKLPADFTETLTESEKNRLAIQVEKAHDQAVTNVAKDLLSNFTAERREEINKYKEDLREGAEQEVGKDNLYVASDMLMTDNDSTNAKALANKYIELNANDLNVENEPLSEKDAMYLDKFDMLAESLGFSSGDELAQKMIASPSKEQAIRAIIDGKVNEKFPDYSSEKKERFEKAKEALYNDETGLVLAEESRLIENKVNAMEQSKLTAEENKKSALALRENMKLAAQDELAGKRIPDATNAKRYMTAERKAGEQAAIALANKDYSLALQYKRVQLYNLSLVQEAMNIKREVASNLKYLKQNGKAKRETWIKEEHFVQAAALMERFGVVRKDFDPATKTESLQDWATRIDEMYDNVAIEPWLYSDKQAFTPDKMLTASELVDVVNALKNIKKVAQDEGKFSKLMGGKMLEEVTSKLVEQLTPMETIYTPEPGKDQPVSKAKRYAATSENRDTFLGRLDKWKHGLFTQLFGDSIEEKMNDEVRMRYKYRDTEEALLNECFPTQRDKDNANKKIYYEELKNSTDKMTLIELALNVGSESSKRVVMGTPPVGFENSPLWVKGDALTTEDNVMRFLGKTLNVNEWNYVEGAWKNMKFLWPLAQEVQRQATGFANKGVVATPFEVTLADGTKKILPGGYHPLKKDYRIGLQSNENVDESAPLYEQNKGIRTMHTYTGYQIARTGATYAISLSPGTRFGIVDQIIKDINFRILAGDFRKLLNNEQFAGTLKSKIGREGYGVFKEYLQTSSNPWTESVGEGEKNLSSILMWLRSKVIHVAIMVKFHTAFQNLGNFPLYAHADEDFSYGDMAEGTRRAIFDYNTPGKFKDAYDFATSKSIFIRERTALPDIAIKEIVNSDKQNAMEKKTAKWGVQMLSFTDNLSGIPMWTVAYEKYMKQGKTEKEAVRFADGVVRKTLGSSRSTDTASILRTGSTMRILTMFQTFFNTQYQQWAKEANIFMSEKDVGRLTAFVASKWLMFCFLNMLTNLQNPFDEKDREEFYKDVLTYPMQIAGPAGQMGTEVIKRAGGFKTFGYRMSAVQSAIDGTINTAGKIGSVARGEAEPSAIVEPLANTLGMYYGVPGQFNTLFFNGYDTLFNNMEPRPTDIMKRRPKRER